MKKIFHYSIVFSALLAVSRFTASAAEDPAAESKPERIGRMKALLVTLTASVQAINYSNRELTLKGPLGNEETVIVDERVKRFDEIKVGDNVTTDYYVSIAAELRKPTPDEEKNPIALAEVAGKAPEGSSPAAAGLRRVKVVTTIEGLDRTTQTVTVKGPLGRYHTVRVEDPTNLPKMRIGENIVVTYTEALAISVEKVEKKSGE